jgi:anaerobic magnesium-protoporphyrin IX monomethyl ester cyclase
MGKKMKTHISLVNPPYPQGAHQHPPFIPLGLGYIAAVLEKNQFAVDVIDCQALKLTQEDFKTELAKRQPDIVGVTSTTLTYKSALHVMKTAKETHPKCVTAIGGPHVTFWDENALNECPEIDVVVRKEGENTMLELSQRVEAGKTFHDLLGTTCKKNGKIVRNEDRAYIENLDELPFPAHHLFPLSHLQKYGKVIFPLSTSRGCTFWCNFCSAVRMFGRKYRMRSPKSVIEELQFLYDKFGARQFTFYDDAFSVDQKRAFEICEEIQKRKMKILWDCETRVDMVTKELLDEMKKAGCLAVWFGVEAGSKQVLDAMAKGLTLEKTKKAFKMAKESGLMTVASVILGFPEETPETARETIKFVEEIKPDDVGYYIATPYPGTPMYDYVKETGWLKIEDFNKYDTATPTFETPTMKMKELRKIREDALQKFYVHPGYVLRMFRKGGVYGYSATKTALAHYRRRLKSKLKPTE